ncbi:hypothetical protein HNR23_000693 [Nocardiopsis mwathae]|uniref:Lipoprotein n=1 Tax=Nocardiopsis mwathae TaxID=1472723 RepID=A0A7W9YED1_9ACTN|nr:hypothetical protein [Nocardiopsis mwathae]MBB6170633.1 hypothetical protein [Nocardiopsis mwathae]
MMRALSAAALGLLIGLLSGCGILYRSTIDEDEAAERVDLYVEEAMGALPEQARLEPFGSSTSASCDENRVDRVTVDRQFWVKDLPEEENEQTMQMIYDHWIDSGYDLVSDERPRDVRFHFENDADDFKMFASENRSGDISIGAVSPCIWTEGTPRQR